MPFGIGKVRVFSFFSIFLFLLIVLDQFDSPNELELYNLLIVCAVGCALIAAQAIANIYPQRTLWFYYCCIYCVFHFGLAPIFLVPDQMWSANNRFGLSWYYDFYHLRTAVFLSLVFLCGLFSANLIPQNSNRPPQMDNRIRYYLHYCAIALLSICIAVWFILILLLGATDYVEFNTLNETSQIGGLWGFLHPAIHAGFILAVLSGRARLPFAIFLAWGGVAFLIGLRGDVAFPLAISLAIVVSQKRLKLPAWAMIVGAILFFSFSSVIAITRVSGDTNAAENQNSALIGLAELGGSLRPVYEVTRWVEYDGYQYGNTYYAPFERTFLGIFPIASRIPGERDERLMNVLILNRVGPFGFSIAAEAYYNFGLLGCYILAVFVGWLLIRIGTLLSYGRYSALPIAVTLGLIVHIRQSFVTLYGVAFVVMVFASTLIFLANIIAGTKASNSRS